MRGLAWLGQNDSYRTGPEPAPAPKPIPVIITPLPVTHPIPLPGAAPGTGPMVRTLPDGTTVTGTVIEGQFVASPSAATAQETQRIEAEISATESEYLKTIQDIKLKDAHRTALAKRRAAIEAEGEKRRLWLMRDAARLEALLSRTPPGPRRKALEAQYMRDFGPQSKTAGAIETLKAQVAEANRHLGAEIRKTDEMLAQMSMKGAQLAKKLKALTGLRRGEQPAGAFPAAVIELGERAVATELE